MGKKIKLTNMITLIPLAFLALFFIFLPIADMIKLGFTTPDIGGFTFDNYKTIFTDSVYQTATINSIYLSFWSALIGLAISFFVAYAVNEVGKKAYNRAMSVLNMVSNFAGLPLYFAFTVILGNSGLIILALREIGIDLGSVFKLYSTDGLMAMFIYFQIPLGSLMLVPAFQAVKPEWKEAAELLEASPSKFWTRVGIPVLLPSLLDTFGLLFANAITAYSTVILLVTTNIPLLPVKITTMFTGEMKMQREMGSALTLWMMCLMLLVIFVCNLLKKIFYKGGQ